MRSGLSQRWLSVPIKVACSNCGFVLAEFREIKNKMNSAAHVAAAKYGYRCPRCLAKLSKKPIRVEVRS